MYEDFLRQRAWTCPSCTAFSKLFGVFIVGLFQVVFVVFDVVKKFLVVSRLLGRHFSSSSGPLWRAVFVAFPELSFNRIGDCSQEVRCSLSLRSLDSQDR